MNLVPDGSMGDCYCEHVLCALDVKDAFLQVRQQEVFRIRWQGSSLQFARIFQAEDMAPKNWFFRKYSAGGVNFEWSLEQPCLAKCGHNIFMVHVDVSSLLYWDKEVLERHVSFGDAIKVRRQLQCVSW